MANVLRIIDANANRAREALRVMEEAARFILDNRALTEALKMLRHDLAETLAGVEGLVPSRDTPGDVGTGLTTGAEVTRVSVAQVVTAAGKRLSEALRAIEEYGKILGDRGIAANFAGNIEQLRYRGYDMEQRLDRALASGRCHQWRLCVLISESLCPTGDWFGVATAAVDAGADCIQLRETSMDAGELLRRTGKLVQLCRPRGASVIVNDRPDVALLADADGVHLGQSDLPCRQARRLVGRQLIVGVSTARLDQAQRALEDGADYCGVGPMFPTTTKQKDVIVGPDYLSQYLQWGKLPHLAISGITPDNIHRLVEIGVRGIAVSSAVCSAGDPAQATRRLLEALSGTQNGCER